MIMDQVSERIHDLLNERGISPYELSKRCKGLSRSSIYNALNGTKVVTLETMDCICKGLEISLSEFFRFADAVEMNLSEDERASMDIYRQLDEVRQNRFKGYMLALFDEMKNSRE